MHYYYYYYYYYYMHYYYTCMHLTGSAVEFTTALQVFAMQVVDMSTGISVHCIVSSTNSASDQCAVA